MIPVQSFLPWKISVTVLHVLAISLTCLRLECRRRSRKLWWDDYAAILPMVVNIMNIVALWLRLRYTPQPREYRVLYSHLNTFFWLTRRVIDVSFNHRWSRISLALAVVRITPLFSRLRRFLVGMTVAFIFMWVSLLSARITRCALSTEWKRGSSAVLICGPGYWLAIARLSCDIVGDIFLVAIPLYQLWNISLPPEERLRVRLVFSTSLITLLSAIVVCLLSYGGIARGPGSLIVWLMISQIEAAVSLIVCNLLVLICWVHRYLHPKKEEEGNEDEGEEKHRVSNKNHRATSLDSLEEILNIRSAGSIGSSQVINEQARSITHLPPPSCSIQHVQ